MKSKNKIKRLRENNPFMKMSDIARTVGVNRNYVFRMLTKAGLSTIIPSYRKHHYCKICNKRLKRNIILCSNEECKIKYYKLEVTCSFCKKTFLRNRGVLRQGYRRGNKYIHCSRRCYQRRRNKELV